MFLPETPVEGGDFELRAKAVGLTGRELLRMAADAYPELDEAAALRAYQRDVAAAASHPNDANADNYTPFRSR